MCGACEQENRAPTSIVMIVTIYDFFFMAINKWTVDD